MTDILACSCKTKFKDHMRRNEQAGFVMHLCFDHAKAHDEGHTFTVGRIELNR